MIIGGDDDYVPEADRPLEDLKWEADADREEEANKSEERAETLYDIDAIETRKADEEKAVQARTDEATVRKLIEKDHIETDAVKVAEMHQVALAQAVPTHQKAVADFRRRAASARPEDLPGLQAEAEQLLEQHEKIAESEFAVNRVGAVKQLGTNFPWLKNADAKQKFITWAEDKYDITAEEAMSINDPGTIYQAARRFERDMTREAQAKQAEATERRKEATAKAQATKAYNALTDAERAFVRDREDGNLNPLSLYDGPHQEFVKRHGARIPKGAM